MAEDEKKAREAGCDDYDTKPVELERLLGKIQKLLGGATACTNAEKERPAASLAAGSPRPREKIDLSRHAA